MALLEIALAYALSNEGGLVATDAQDDRGGLSFAGITAKTWAAYSGQPLGKTWIPLTMDQVRGVYNKLYWQVIKGEAIKSQGVATVFFDMAVLTGPARATKMMQEVVGAATDGVCGPKTLAAINAMPPGLVVQRFSFSACNFFMGIALADPTQVKWVRGWQLRAHRMASVSIV